MSLSRGIDCTIVLCQRKLLQSTLKPGRGKRYNCLANMATDAEFRKCVTVHKQLDMHPDAVKARQAIYEESLAMAQKEVDNEKLEFIHHARQFWKTNLQDKPRPLPVDKPDVYHTSRGVTTRPIGNPDLVIQADKHYKDVAKRKQKVTSFEARDERMESGTLAPTPSDLASNGRCTILQPN